VSGVDRLRRYGDRAVLIETTEPLRVAAALRDQAGLVEVVPAAATVLVVLVVGPGDPVPAVAELLRARQSWAESGPGAAPAESIVLPVRYDGADLAAVAAELGLSPAAVVAAHTGATYTVAFCGFAPGFAYLTGLDPALVVGRHAEPRLSVPRGSVAIAGEFTGVYPRSSPGVWQLLGHTDVELWNTGWAQPARLSPGATVRFTPA
jgi:KipI family sensor histidine kinase inhibitor